MQCVSPHCLPSTCLRWWHYWNMVHLPSSVWYVTQHRQYFLKYKSSNLRCVCWLLWDWKFSRWSGGFPVWDAKQPGRCDPPFRGNLLFPVLFVPSVSKLIPASVFKGEDQDAWGRCCEHKDRNQSSGRREPVALKRDSFVMKILNGTK